MARWLTSTAGPLPAMRGAKLADAASVADGLEPEVGIEPTTYRLQARWLSVPPRPAHPNSLVRATRDTRAAP